VRILEIPNFLSKEDLRTVMNDIKVNREKIVINNDLYDDKKHYKRWYIEEDYEGRRNQSRLLRVLENELYRGKAMYFANHIWEAPWQLMKYTNRSETQITEHSVDDFYIWHEDSDQGRIFNYILYLSECEGGELHVSKSDTWTSDIIVKPKINHLVIMPSFLWHMVAPVTKGTRLSINGHMGFAMQAYEEPNIYNSRKIII